MIERTRCGETERAGAHGFRRELRHRLVVLLRRGIAARAALAHHIDAQRRMRQLRADIHVEVPLRQPVHVIGKALPRPGNAGAQHRLGNVFHAFHQLDQPRVVGRLARRKADAAIAHFGDAPAGNRNVGLVEIAALAVGNVAAADHEVRGIGHGASSLV
ncbi:hypothetical protein ES703_102194 [subsurface metagenome]